MVLPGPRGRSFKSSIGVPVRLRPLLLLCALAGGCGGEAPTPHWSLEPGAWFLYAARRETQAAVGVERLWVRNGGQVAAPDGGVAWLREWGGGSAELLRVEARGLLRLAWLSGTADGRRVLEPTETLLVPVGGVPGVSWEHVDRTRLLERKVDGYGRLFVVEETARLAFRIVAEGETVDVPAGRFGGCMRLEGRARGRFQGDRTVTGGHFGIAETQWHAPGVGLVRLEREETTEGGIIPFGRYQLELIGRGPD